MLKHLLIAALAAVTGVAGAAGPANQKVILDTDFTTTSDDGMVGIMAAQLHAEGVIELLGITVVAGNEWLPQEVADALRAVERLGIASVGVYAGARYPLVHDYRNLQQEKALWGVGGSWYRRPEPADGSLIAPFDGFAATTRVQREHAVAFIVDTVKKYPHDVTLLAIGPLTNIALAIRMNPEIVPLIKRIVYMGGAFEVPGNTTPSAEMNSGSPRSGPHRRASADRSGVHSARRDRHCPHEQDAVRADHGRPRGGDDEDPEAVRFRQVAW